MKKILYAMENEKDNSTSFRTSTRKAGTSLRNKIKKSKKYCGHIMDKTKDHSRKKLWKGGKRARSREKCR